MLVEELKLVVVPKAAKRPSRIHEDDLADTARAAGDAYIPNSYSPRQLLAKVREHLSLPAPTR